jgi:hypothetical protein
MSDHLRTGSQVSFTRWEGSFVSLDFGGCYLVFSESCVDYSEPSCSDFSVRVYTFFVLDDSLASQDLYEVGGFG